MPVPCLLLQKGKYKVCRESDRINKHQSAVLLGGASLSRSSNGTVITHAPTLLIIPIQRPSICDSASRVVAGVRANKTMVTNAAAKIGRIVDWPEYHCKSRWLIRVRRHVLAVPAKSRPIALIAPLPIRERFLNLQCFSAVTASTN